MKENFERALALLLKHEGGYVNHPKDPGGHTNLGVTLRTWEHWMGRTVTPEELKALTSKDVYPLYRIRYWAAVRGDELPSGVDYALFDFAVNSGSPRAIKTLQAGLGVTQDGILGPTTLKILGAQEPAQVIEGLATRRLRGGRAASKT